MNRKNLFKIILIILCFGFMMEGFAVDTEGPVAQTFCSDVSKTMQLAGYFVLLIKIAVPLLVVVMGTLDFYNTVMSGKDSDFKKEAIVLGKRFLIGIIVFLIPNIIDIAINVLDKDPGADYKICIDCITKPFSCPVKKD